MGRCFSPEYIERLRERASTLVEKYRPITLDQIIGQEHVVSKLKSIVKAYRSEGIKIIPHFLFYSPTPGTGKTSTAYALAYELGWELCEFNASDERSIQVVRTDIKNLARTKPSTPGRFILLDEADSLTEDAQEALRRIMEQSLYTNTRFILTCNYVNKIIEPIRSRTVMYSFKPLPSEEILKYIVYVLRSEGVKMSPEDAKAVRKELLKLIKFSRGDMRTILNRLQEVIANNRTITPEILRTYLPYSEAEEIIDLINRGDFKNAWRKTEEYFIVKGFDPYVLLESLREVVSARIASENDPATLYRYAKIASAIATVERSLKLGADPLTQLLGLIGELYVVMSVKPRVSTR